VRSGRMRSIIEGTEYTDGTGESISIPPGTPHMADFAQDTVLLEVSAPPVR